MPHYKDGRLCRVGQIAELPSYDGAKLVGVVCKVGPQESACNFHVIPLAKVYQADGHTIVVPMPAISPQIGECSKSELLRDVDIAPPAPLFERTPDAPTGTPGT